ncbi:Protein neuralized [Linum perenne]
MAIAGLQNVSVLDSSFLRDSQSDVVRSRGDDGRVNTRASSLLRMWRELEDEHGVSHGQGRVSERLLQNRGEVLSNNNSRGDDGNRSGSEHNAGSEDVSGGESEYGQWSPRPTESENGHEDSSSDLGEMERERVRQIFREWMSSGARERTPHTSRRNGSRAEWLGETEQERVRIIREWVQRNTRQRGARVDRGDDHGPAAGQIEQVLDSLNLRRNEGQTEYARRGIRRVCGRQALLDMLKKAERERQRELQGLLEHRAVTQFAHRHRIQSLLRGRFLRNDRMVETERPRSTAARELGLLRQRNAVADLREGLFSRVDQSVSGQQGTNASDTSSNIDVNGDRIEQSEANDSQMVLNGSPDRTEESNSYRIREDRNDMQATTIEGSVDRLEDRSGQAAQNVDTREHDRTSTYDLDERTGDNAEEMNEPLHEGADDFLLQRIASNENGEPESTGEGNETPSVYSRTNYFESTAIEHANQHFTATAQAEESEDLISESESREMPGTATESVEWRDGHQHDEAAADQWYENHDTAEAPREWHEDSGFQEAVHSWLEEEEEEEEEEEPFSHDTAPVGRIDPFYFTDDDNVYNEEIRELLSRRSVSTLLRSGFRESLDQLIRSYVERQTHATLDWDEASASIADQESDHQHLVDQNPIRGTVPTPPPAPPLPPSQRLWDRESQRYHWPHHDMHPSRFGIEWDIINDMRIDMARLQQRMNNMQRMLEACMDMQLELQRSIRQEVSAALNRSPSSPGTCEIALPDDPLKWDHVRKGMCCICGDSNIDSLLYRCGHMCTCSKCANELVRTGNKCPMCRAPVIEVVRAYYSIS